MHPELQMNEGSAHLIRAEDANAAVASEAQVDAPIEGEGDPEGGRQASRQQEPPAVKEGEVEAPKSFGGYRDRAREEMVARFRQQRAQSEDAIKAAEEGREPEPEPEPTQTLEGELEHQRLRRRDAADQPRDDQGRFAPKPADASPDATIRLKLLGEEIDFTRTEVVQASGFSDEDLKHVPWKIVQETAQKRLAAEVYLRRSRDASKQPQPQPQQQQPQAQPQARPEPQQQGEDLDEAEAKLQEALVYGTPEEAAAELKKFRAAVTRAAGTEAARQAVAQVQHQQRWEDVGREVRDEWAAINREHPELQQGPFASTMRDHAVQVTKAVIVDAIERMPDHLKAAFEQRGLTAQRIMSLGDDGQVAQLYRDMAAKGYPVAPPKLVLREAAKRAVADVEKVTGRPSRNTTQAAPTVQVDRAARREAISTIPPRATAPPQAPQKRKTVSDVIAEMRRVQPQRR